MRLSKGGVMKRVMLTELLRAPREVLRQVPFELWDSTGVLAVVLPYRKPQWEKRENWRPGNERKT